MKHYVGVWAGVILLVVAMASGVCQSQSPAQLPQGVKAVWDLSKAYRETTPTRERICINGLWCWQPAKEGGADLVPAGGWGYFKVPGCWPGITDYMQKDCQTVYAHPDWKQAELGRVTAAWYQRRITIPSGWARRRIAVCAEYLNSYAAVYVDGKRAGDLKDGRIAFTEKWKPDKLWDIHTPENIYDLSVSLLDGGGRVLDTGYPLRFGFREFWIDGRDFYLNGTCLFLSAVPLDNAQISAAGAWRLTATGAQA